MTSQRVSLGKLSSYDVYRVSPGNLALMTSQRGESWKLSSYDVYRVSPGNLALMTSQRVSLGSFRRTMFIG